MLSNLFIWLVLNVLAAIIVSKLSSTFIQNDMNEYTTKLKVIGEIMPPEVMKVIEAGLYNKYHSLKSLQLGMLLFSFVLYGAVSFLFIFIGG